MELYCTWFKHGDLFLDFFLQNLDDEQPTKKQKSTGKSTQNKAAKKNGKENTRTKKKANASVREKEAAEKERKRIERERANAQKEKERKALTERNNSLLEQMASLVRGGGSEDSFTSDVVRECCDLTFTSSDNISTTRVPAPPQNPLVQLQTTITELQSASPRPTLTIQQLQNTLASLKDSTPGGLQLPTTAIQPHDAPSGSTSAGSMQALPRQQRSRPTVGGKCPRRNLLQESDGGEEEEEDETCESCRSLKRRVRELENQIKQFQGEGNYSSCILIIIF